MVPPPAPGVLKTATRRESTYDAESRTVAERSTANGVIGRAASHTAVIT
ncbi:hypothetical protein ACIA98_21130 [Streptomyces sp. NPDC051366]